MKFPQFGSAKHGARAAAVAGLSLAMVFGATVAFSNNAFAATDPNPAVAQFPAQAGHPRFAVSVHLHYVDPAGHTINSTIAVDQSSPLLPVLPKVKAPAKGQSGAWVIKTNATIKEGKKSIKTFNYSRIGNKTLPKEGVHYTYTYFAVGQPLETTHAGQFPTAGTPLETIPVKVSYVDFNGKTVSTTIAVDSSSPVLSSLPHAKPAVNGQAGAWVDGEGKAVTKSTMPKYGESYTFKYGVQSQSSTSTAVKPAAKTDASATTSATKKAMPAANSAKQEAAAKKEAAASKAATKKAMPAKKAVKASKKGTPETADASMIAPIATASLGLVSSAAAVVLKKRS